MSLSKKKRRSETYTQKDGLPIAVTIRDQTPTVCNMDIRKDFFKVFIGFFLDDEHKLKSLLSDPSCR